MTPDSSKAEEKQNRRYLEDEPTGCSEQREAVKRRGCEAKLYHMTNGVRDRGGWLGFLSLSLSLDAISLRFLYVPLFFFTFV